MKALFLVGGSGTRLRPLTNNIPKPMIPVMGKPLLERTVMRMKACGISEIIFSTCYQPKKIADHFSDGSAFGISASYVFEETPLGTGGAIKNAERFMDDTFFVCNADILSDIDLKKMLAQHKRRKADITIAATYVPDPSAYGVIEYNSSEYVTRFTEKPKADEIRSHYINAGVYIFEPRALCSIPSDRAVSVEREIFPSVLEGGGRIAVYRHNGYWMDLGTPDKYIQANHDIFRNLCQITEADFSKSPVYIDRSAHVKDSVRIEDRAYIGHSARIGAHCHLNNNCIIGTGSMLGVGCRLTNCIVWPGVQIPNGMELNSCIVLKGTPGYIIHSYHDLLAGMFTDENARRVS